MTSNSAAFAAPMPEVVRPQPLARDRRIISPGWSNLGSTGGSAKFQSALDEVGVVSNEQYKSEVQAAKKAWKKHQRQLNNAGAAALTGGNQEAHRFNNLVNRSAYSFGVRLHFINKAHGRRTRSKNGRPASSRYRMTFSELIAAAKAWDFRDPCDELVRVIAIPKGKKNKEGMELFRHIVVFGVLRTAQAMFAKEVVALRSQIGSGRDAPSIWNKAQSARRGLAYGLGRIKEALKARGKKFVIKLDFKNFYPSLNRKDDLVDLLTRNEGRNNGMSVKLMIPPRLARQVLNCHQSVDSNGSRSAYLWPVQVEDQQGQPEYSDIPVSAIRHRSRQPLQPVANFAADSPEVIPEPNVEEQLPAADIQPQGEIRTNNNTETMAPHGLASHREIRAIPDSGTRNTGDTSAANAATDNTLAANAVTHMMTTRLPITARSPNRVNQGSYGLGHPLLNPMGIREARSSVEGVPQGSPVAPVIAEFVITTFLHQREQNIRTPGPGVDTSVYVDDVMVIGQCETTVEMSSLQLQGDAHRLLPGSVELVKKSYATDLSRKPIEYCGRSIQRKGGRVHIEPSQKNQLKFIRKVLESMPDATNDELINRTRRWVRSFDLKNPFEPGKTFCPGLHSRVIGAVLRLAHQYRPDLSQQIWSECLRVLEDTPTPPPAPWHRPRQGRCRNFEGLASVML